MVHNGPHAGALSEVQVKDVEPQEFRYRRTCADHRPGPRQTYDARVRTDQSPHRPSPGLRLHAMCPTPPLPCLADLHSRRAIQPQAIVPATATPSIAGRLTPDQHPTTDPRTPTPDPLSNATTTPHLPAHGSRCPQTPRHCPALAQLPGNVTKPYTGIFSFRDIFKKWLDRDERSGQDAEHGGCTERGAGHAVC